MDPIIIAGIQFSKHANEMLHERNIQREWIERTIQKPDRMEKDSGEISHFIKKISEHGDRYLRIVVNTQAMPKRAVTLFFDRRLGRKL